RRQSLHLDVEVRWQVAAQLIHPRLRLLQRDGHVGVRRERRRDLTRAADGFRRDARDARHDRDRLLDRLRDGEDDLTRAERRALRDDRDARELELGIDGRRQPQRGPDAAGAQQRDDEVDEPPLARHGTRERPAPARWRRQRGGSIARGAALDVTHDVAHGFAGTAVVTLALSSMPNAPCVTTVSPPASPSTISTFVGVRPPTFTSCSWAVPVSSTTNTL